METGEKLWCPELNEHVAVASDLQTVKDPKLSPCFTEGSIIKITGTGGSLVFLDRPETNGRSHHHGPSENGGIKHFSWNRLVEGTVDYTKPAFIPQGRSIPVLVATVIDPTQAAGWPAITQVRLDRERLNLAGQRVTPAKLSAATAKDTSVLACFEIGGNQWHSRISFFPYDEEFHLPKAGAYGLIHTILLHSFAKYGEMRRLLTETQKMDPTNIAVFGERALRFLTQSGSGTADKRNFVINPYNFTCIKVESWLGHIEEFFKRSAFAANVGQVALLRFLDKHSTAENFAVINCFSQSPFLVGVSMVPRPVVFVRGDTITGEWVGDRTDLLETICFELYGTPEAEGLDRPPPGKREFLGLETTMAPAPTPRLKGGTSSTPRRCSSRFEGRRHSTP